MSDMETADRRLRTALLPYQPRLLHDVLDSLDVAVVVLDELGRVLAANVAASHLLGVRRGRRAADVPPDHVPTVTDQEGDAVDVLDADALRALARTSAALLRAERPDGVRWLSMTVHPLAVNLGDGEAAALVCRYTDVTAARELERRAVAAADLAARAEIDLDAAERRVAMLEELLVYLATGNAVPES
jgi:PAS domain-containing protein